MEPTNPRVRLVFEDGGILSKSQKKEGLKHSWLLLKPQLRTISDVVAYLLHTFNLHDSCPNGIILSMDGFVLPPFESTAIFKDKDIICVKKKTTKLRDVIKAIKGVDTLIQDEIIEKQPLPLDIKLLANEEYNKEAGGYESETDDGEDVANVVAPENSPHGDVISKSKKRKASSRAESSKTKTKRRKHITPENDQKKPVTQCEQVKTPEKKRKHENRSKEDAISYPEDIAKGTKNIEPTSAFKESGEPERNGEKVTPESAELSGANKVSRSTRRKKLKRLWAKENRTKANMENHQCEDQPGEDPINDPGSGKDPENDPGSKMDVNKNIVQDQQADENSDAEDNLVPVMIRPGHIRFTPSAKVKDFQHNPKADVQHNPEASGWGVHTMDNGVWKGHSVKKNTWDTWGGRNNQGAKETFEWNGITSKRKGQKWGMEKQQTSSWKESRDYDVSFSLPPHYKTSSQNGILQEPSYCNGITHNKNGEKLGIEKQPSSSWIGSRDDNAHSSAGQLSNDATVRFEKLAPLTDLPKAGDIIAYRLVELSATWCPELSSFRVGKVSWFQSQSNRILLVPDPEYPLNLEKKIDGNDDDDDSGQPPEFSLYDEDGSLEIDFPSLVDVRVVKHGDLNHSGLSKTQIANGIPFSSETLNQVQETQVGSKKNVTLNSSNGDLNTSAPAHGKKDVWEEISEALSAKKAELTREDRWDKKEDSAKRSWSRRGSALGPIMERLRSQNAI